MLTNVETNSWKGDLSAFSKRNYLRPTRLEVVGAGRNMESDFWLEDGLQLAGIDLETDGEHGASVEIMLQGSKAKSSNHMTHSIAGVKRIALNTSDNQDEGLEIEDAEGSITILHFESEVTNVDRSARK